MLVISIFSYSHNVYKNCLPQGCDNMGCLVRLQIVNLQLKKIQHPSNITFSFIYTIFQFYTKIHVIERCVKFITGPLGLNPLPEDKFLDSSKLKEFADDNFKFEENGRKLSKQVGNTVGKGEIACNEQFLLFPQCFQKVCFLGTSKGVIVWE